MNKRPLGPTGLPAKPGNPGVPHHQPSNIGPAPPLPPGPVPGPQQYSQQPQQQMQYPQQYPQQGQYNQQQMQGQGGQVAAAGAAVDPAAHAAAWAAYYQATGQPNPYAQSQPTAANIGTSPNPAAGTPAAGAYANYGYGAGATHANHLQPTPQPVQQQVYQYPQPQQQQGYPAYGPQQPQPQGYRPPVAAGSFGYNSPIPPNQFQPQPHQNPLYAHQQQQQFYPQQTPPHQQGGFRPGTGPSPVRPFQPRPPRPPGMAMSPGPAMQGGIPPAKRPRFDGPGPVPGAGGMYPPTRPGQTGIINNGQPGFNPRPPVGQLPTNPPIHLGLGVTRPPATPPIVRPPIHLGMGGPPPPGIIAPRGPSFARGGAAGRGGRGGAVNVPGAPRGPAGMQRRGAAPIPFGSTRRGPGGGYLDRERVDERERERERERKREKERGPGTTMTDFRIVGIQIKGEEEDWKWGWVEDEARALHPSEDKVEEKKEVDEVEVKQENGGEKTEEVKVESEVNGSTEAEEKRGEKRKAKSPDGEDESEGSHKKRAAHDSTSTSAEAVEPTPQVPEINAPTPSTETAEPTVKVESETEPAVSVKTEHTLPPKPIDPISTETRSPTPETAVEVVSKYEEPQNRFRIYFDSPPELDRIPKAIRRGNNKRWRRESSSIAPGGVGYIPGSEAKENGDGEKVEDVGETPKVESEITEGSAVQGEEASKEVETEKSETVAVAAEDTQLPSENIAPIVPEVPNVSEFPEVPEAGEEPPSEVSEPVEEVGDISMRSDIGAMVDQLEEQVAAEAVIDVSLTPLPEDPTSTLPTIPTLSTESLPPKPVLDVVAPSSHDVGGQNGEEEETEVVPTGPQPSVNRISILYEESSRRICVDAEAVEGIRIYRGEGKIEVALKAVSQNESAEDGEKEKVEGELRKGVLMEMYDTTDERFVPVTSTRLAEIYSQSESTDPTSTTSESVPPLHHSGPMTITVWLNKKRPLSEPKWCRSNSADEWLFEIFTSRRSTSGPLDNLGWRGKLQVIDPEPIPTLSSILESWSESAMIGNLSDRKTFIESFSVGDPAETLEIILRLARGDRNPTYGGGGNGGFGLLAGSVKPESPYASHQTHVSLAVLQMFRLTVAYADKAGEGDKVKEQVEDIVRSLPTGMIQKSLDGLFREWGDKRVK